jgi:hypothetical protein
VALVVGAVLVYFLNKPGPEGGPGPEVNNPAPEDPVAKGKPDKERPPPERPPPEPPRPVFTLSGNGAGRLRLFQSWPLLVHGQLLHPQAFARDEKVEPMVLAAADGPWTGSVRLEIRDAKGKKVDWPWHLATAAKPKVTLDNKTSGYVAWWLTAEETAAIPPGDYQLIGMVDTTSAKAADLWKGNVSSRPVKIQVAAEPKPLFTEQEEKKSVLLANLAQLRGDPKQALVQVDALLTRQPKSLAGLELKGDLLAELGQTEAALRQYDQALAAYLALRPRWGEPPQGLLRKHREVLVRFLKQ